MGVLDKFFSVDLAFQTYNELIKLWEVKTPLVNYNGAIMYIHNSVMLARLLLSSYSAQIARVNENILDLEDIQKVAEYNKKIENYMDSVPAFSNIVAKVPLSPQEIKQKVKNALAHAEYNLIYKQDNNIEVDIDTEFIKGVIPFADIDELWRFYTTMSDELELNDIVFTGTDDLFNLSTNNVNLLKSAINKLGICKLDKKGSVDNNMTLFSHNYDPLATPLNDKAKELILNYIRYIGLSEWIKLSYYQRGMIFSRVFKFLLTSKNNFRNSSSNISFTLYYCLFKGNGWVSKSDMYYTSFEAPVIYAGLILDLGFLSLNYIKEVLHKETNHNFNYRDINLSSIKYSPSDCVKYVTTSEEQRKLEVIKSELENRKSKLSLNISKAQEDIKNIQRATSITEEKKKEIIEVKQNKLNSNLSLLEEVNNKLAIINDKYNNARDYFDTNDFFKHLRNSISHGFYTVDYSEALKRKDLSKIIFKFQDWDINPDDRTDRKLVFSAEISASKLLDLFQQLHDRLVESYDTLDQYYEKELLYDDIRKNKNLSAERAEEFLEFFRKKGFRLIKKQ